MKKGLSLVVLLVLLNLLVGTTLGMSGQPMDKAKPEMIIGIDYDEDGGADAYANAGDNANSRYYVNLDFYNMTSDDQLTIIPRFNYATNYGVVLWQRYRFDGVASFGEHLFHGDGIG